MKTPALRYACTARAARGFAQIVLSLLFLVAVFQLAQLPSTMANHDAVDLWRGLALGSLFVFFCIPGARQPTLKP